MIIDDGSSPDRQAIFDGLARLPRVVVLHHYVNLGKGAALKTGLHHVGFHHRDLVGAVTADADGQHTVADILRVGRTLLEHPQDLVLGARRFDGNVPWRSRFGNELTRAVMRLIGGWKMSDTQTGLRGIPRPLFPSLLRLRSRGYEFELDMLMAAKRLGVHPREISIETIYIEGNRSSHFDPVLDSMRIYFVLLRFFFSSLSSALIDNLVFALAYAAWSEIAAAQAAARVVSASINFYLNKKVVFQSEAPAPGLALKYVTLVAVSGLLSYALILLLHVGAGLPVLLSKILAETLVFLFNFTVQRDLVFTGRATEAA